jgi:hypothetical protein
MKPFERTDFWWDPIDPETTWPGELRFGVPGRYCVALGWTGPTTAAYTLTMTTCVDGGATACSDIEVSR